MGAHWRTAQSDVSPPPTRPWYRHLGSTIAIVLGVLYFAVSIKLSGLPIDGVMAGPVMVLGAFAYPCLKPLQKGFNATTSQR